MTDTIIHKRGDTLLWQVQTDSDLTGAGIRMQIRDPSSRVMADVSVGTGITIDGTDHTKYTITIPAATTATWPTLTAKFDIEYTIGGVVDSTETKLLQIVEDVTR